MLHSNYYINGMRSEYSVPYIHVWLMGVKSKLVFSMMRLLKRFKEEDRVTKIKEVIN